MVFAVICLALVLNAEEMGIKTTGGPLKGGGWNIWSNGCVGQWVKFKKGGKYRVSVEANGEPAVGITPIMAVAVDLKEVRRWDVSAGWRNYTAEFEVKAGVHLLTVGFVNDYFGPKGDRNLFVRKVVVDGVGEVEKSAPPDWREQALANIEKHRKGNLAIKVVDAEGAPVAGAEIRVEQLRHEFCFGTAISAQVFAWLRSGGHRAQIAQRYPKILAQNFNWVTIENAFKWHNMEQKERNPHYKDVDAVVEWCRKHRIKVRGHCIFWDVGRFVPVWARRLTKERLADAVRRRIKRDVARYKNAFAEYDVCNEILAGGWFGRKLGKGIYVEMFKLAHKVAPKARLYLNEYAVLTGAKVAEYIRFVRRLRNAGAPVGGIGCQGHLTQHSFNPAIAKLALDRLARLGLPIRVTEFDIVCRNPNTHAKLLEDFYTLCFGHPAVDGILMWGFWEGRHWCPKAALWDRNFKPKPAAKTYRRLVFKKWWTNTTSKTDKNGTCHLRAFYGRHRITARKGGKSATAEVDLTRSIGSASVTLRLK